MVLPYALVILIGLIISILSHNVRSAERKPLSGLMQGSRVFETRRHPYAEKTASYKIKPRT